MIYEQNKILKLPNSISSVLGDKFNHGILFSYLRAIKYFDIIWSVINKQNQVEYSLEWFEIDGVDDSSMHIKGD